MIKCRLDPENPICIQNYNLLSNANFNQTRNMCIVKSSILSCYSDECREENIFLDTGGLCCKWCFNTWSPGSYSLSLQPQRHHSKEIRRLLKKDILSLNKFQHKLITKVRNSALNNTLVMKCTVCSKNTTIALKKYGKEKEINKKESKDLQIVKESVKRKKKKKKPYAGLNPAVFESFNLSKVRTPLPTNTVKKTQPKKLSLKQQQHINKEIERLKHKSSNTSKPSMLSSFLESMAM